jgi:hypothetical protein
MSAVTVRCWPFVLTVTPEISPLVTCSASTLVSGTQLTPLPFR